MATQIRDAEQPAFGARNPGHGVWQHQHFTNLLAAGNKLLLTSSEPNTNPLFRQRTRALSRVSRATPMLHFLQQRKWLVYQCRKISRIIHSARHHGVDQRNKIVVRNGLYDILDGALPHTPDLVGFLIF